MLNLKKIKLLIDEHTHTYTHTYTHIHAHKHTYTHIGFGYNIITYNIVIKKYSKMLRGETIKAYSDKQSYAEVLFRAHCKLHGDDGIINN